MSWQSCRLGDVLTLKRGHDLPEHSRQDGDVPVVSSSGITGRHKESKAKAPGVVTGRYGTIGEVFYLEEDYWPLNTALYVIDFKGNDPQFSAYFLRNILKDYQSEKAAVPGVDRNVLHEIKVRAPDVALQQQIAGILSTYDNLIENNRRRMALLEESARLLYREWFVRLRFPGYEHTPIVDGVPQGWVRVRVDGFGLVLTGKTPSTKDADNYGGEIPFVKTPDMHGNAFVLSSETLLTEKGAKSQANKFLPPGALLVSCIGTVGVVSLTAEVCQFNQQINAVIPSKEIFRYYCYFAFKDMKPRLDAIGGGVTMANVSKGKFESMDLLRPTEALLSHFDGFCKPLFQQIKVLGLQNQKLRAARDHLLPRLMSGEISV
jgi:type I restriction enzyme S subunit